MKVAIYLRKSRGLIEDLHKHKEQLISVCKANDWEYDIYKEIASSVTLDRCELQLLITNIDKYSKVLVVALDRLSRDSYGQAILTNLFKDKNVDIVTPTRTYSHNDESSILMQEFEELIGRQEYRLIAKRMRAGHISSFKQGNWTSGFAPIPYKYNKETKSLVIDPIKLVIWEQIKELALKGYSSYMIEEATNVKALTVRRLLNNKVLLGYVKYNGEYSKGNHMPVLTINEWNVIQNYITGRTNGTTRTKHNYPLTNIVKCSCGHSRSAVRRKDRGNMEVIMPCRYCKDSGLISKSIHETLIVAIANYKHDLIKGFNSNDNNKELARLNKELINIDKDIVKNEKKISKVKDMILNDIMDLAEGATKTKDIKATTKSLENRRILVESDIVNLGINKQDIIDNLNDVYDVLKNNLKDKELNDLYKIIIDKIVIKDKIIQDITWK